MQHKQSKNATAKKESEGSGMGKFNVMHHAVIRNVNCL